MPDPLSAARPTIRAGGLFVASLSGSVTGSGSTEEDNFFSCGNAKEGDFFIVVLWGLQVAWGRDERRAFPRIVFVGRGRRPRKQPRPAERPLFTLVFQFDFETEGCTRRTVAEREVSGKKPARARVKG